jgi:hypothetical protein
MIRIVRPIITSAVGRAVELFSLLPPGPTPQLLPIRRSIVTVDKPVGAGQPNQKTDVLLVRLMLNLVAGTDPVWRERFKTPLPHEPAFDGELGRRVRAYQEAGGFQPLSPRVDPVPPVVVTAFLRRPAAAAVAGVVPVASFQPVKEPLFVDGVIDPCKPHTDRGSRSKLAYAIVHLNYHLLVRLKATQSMRLTPALLEAIDLIRDPKLAPLRAELERAGRDDPDKPRPNPKPNPPDVVI